MCLILFAHQNHPQYSLVLAANRDEFHSRPTLQMDWWEQSHPILAGRDEKAGGTWFGIDESARWAAVTNHRGQGNEENGRPRSRGELITNFLKNRYSAIDYLDRVYVEAEEYRGFNLLVADESGLFYFGNRDEASCQKRPEPLPPGIYGLCNATLNTSWPKLELGNSRLEQLVGGKSEIEHDQVFEVLHETSRPADKQLPETGIGLQKERLLSAMFIEDSDYGTRSSTSVLVSHDGIAEVSEKTHETNSVREFEFVVKAL